MTLQICCEPVKITAKFQWFWILYIIILFFSYTRTAIQITTGVYVIRYWLIIFYSLTEDERVFTAPIYRDVYDT